MSGPVGVVGQPQAPFVPDLTQSKGWDDIERMLNPAKMPNPFKPADEVLMELARYAETEQGRKVLEWLHGVTDRAPYPQVGMSFENVALAAAKHQGRVLVGDILTAAVLEGQALRASQKG
jgi:hypothetical protein